MKTTIVCFISFLISYTSFGQIIYTTSCKIKDGKAYGYVHNQKDGFEIDGDVWFHFYDRDGIFIESEDEYEYEYISFCSTEEVEYTSAPSDACSCSFDVSKATEVENEYEPGNKIALPSQHQLNNPREGLVYSTSCKIEDGKAYGYVHNHEDGFEIDGDVWFYFYDREDEFLDDEDEYEYEYISRKSKEEVEYTSAPSNAYSCFFEIKDAIKD